MFSTMWHVLRSGNVVVFHNDCPGVWADRGHVLLQIWDPATGGWANPTDALVAAARPAVGPPSPGGGTAQQPEESSSEDEVGPSQLHPTPDRRWAVAGPSVTPTGPGLAPGAAPTPPRVLRSISEEEACKLQRTRYSTGPRRKLTCPLFTVLDSPGQADPLYLGNPWGCRRCPTIRQLCASCEALAREEYVAEQAAAAAYLLQKTNEANELAAAYEEARAARQLAEEAEVAAEEAAANAYLDAQDAAARLDGLDSSHRSQP
ncbi:uncharacterized protein LOC127751582 [Frankliniella occidentalis]|uniref:Uncharacterized protein LOC127751582 n=1 Tax=Frankliniella occidentalis TaxID=133901 RepID=A0A9C6X8X1_FRAOC|nr:uncharacterized protein LOC127751582 [Frankliniella occidentalis]